VTDLFGPEDTFEQWLKRRDEDKLRRDELRDYYEPLSTCVELTKYDEIWLKGLKLIW